MFATELLKLAQSGNRYDGLAKKTIELLRERGVETIYRSKECERRKRENGGCDNCPSADQINCKRVAAIVFTATMATSSLEILQPGKEVVVKVDEIIEKAITAKTLKELSELNGLIKRI